MIEAIELTSTRRSRHADGGPVEKVSFDVYPGQVTALLGAPGAGKSTVLRLMVELEPGGGRTLFGGRPYRALRPAVREVGLALNPDAVHPGRTVQAHLQLYAAAGGVPKPRVAEVLEVAGLSTQATVRCGRLDPGQRQRLSIAAALIGDPAALILDEPHALDSHGMSWFHALIRAYASQGRTVLVAATDPDLLSGTADHVIVLRRDERDGISRVIASRSAAEVFDERRATVVQVRSPQAARLAAALEAEGARLAPAGPGALQVRGLDRARIGEVAHVAGVCLHELSEIGHDDVFGLRPLPRQKELLPGLNRAASTWHAGVRVVADKVEEAEVVETPSEAVAEPAQPATAGIGAQAAAKVDAEPQASQGPLDAAAQGAVTGGLGSAVWAGGMAQADAGAQTSQAAAAQASGAIAASVGAEASQGAITGGFEPAASVGAQVVAKAGGTARSDAGAQAAQASALQSTGAPAASVGAEASQKATAGASESPASVGAHASPEQQMAQASGSAADQQAMRAGGEVGAQTADAKPSAVGSWRTQGSVAGSRWSAVKGSQQSPVSPRPSASVTRIADGPASRPVPAPPEPPSTEDAVAAPAPAKVGEVHRRSAFGLRWGRGKPQPSAEPATVAAPVLAQPAVPFTVALPAPEQDAASDGMTPWRAAAARTSQHGQQQASVAEAAPAEQEASA